MNLLESETELQIGLAESPIFVIYSLFSIVYKNLDRTIWKCIHVERSLQLRKRQFRTLQQHTCRHKVSIHLYIM